MARVLATRFDGTSDPGIEQHRGVEDGEITEGTATRDLGKMVEAGLLEPNGEKRGRYYTAAKRIVDIRNEIVHLRNPRDNTDPFGPATQAAPTGRM